MPATDTAELPPPATTVVSKNRPRWATLSKYTADSAPPFHCNACEFTTDPNKTEEQQKASISVHWNGKHGTSRSQAKRTIRKRKTAPVASAVESPQKRGARTRTANRLAKATGIFDRVVTTGSAKKRDYRAEHARRRKPVGPNVILHRVPVKPVAKAAPVKPPLESAAAERKRAYARVYYRKKRKEQRDSLATKTAMLLRSTTENLPANGTDPLAHARERVERLRAALPAELQTQISALATHANFCPRCGLDMEAVRIAMEHAQVR